MIYDNAIIPWDKRNYLPKLYLIFRYIDNCIGSQYSTGRDYLYNEVVVSVGRIHLDYQEMFLENINNSLIEFFSSEIYYPRDGSPCSEVRLCTYNELNDKQRLEEVRSKKIECLSACIQEVKDELEELEKTRFRERNDIEIQTNIIPVAGNLPAVPAVSVVQRDIIWQDTRPAINAEGGEAFNRDELAEISVGNTTRILSQSNNISKKVNGIDKKVDGIQTQLDRIEEALQNNQEQAPAVEDRDEYYLSIPDIDLRNVAMWKDGMKPKDIQDWNNKNNIPQCHSIDAINQSLYRGKIKVGILPKPKK